MLTESRNNVTVCNQIVSDLIADVKGGWRLNNVLLFFCVCVFGYGILLVLLSISKVEEWAGRGS